MPQLPQLSSSVSGSMQVWLQAMVPSGQADGAPQRPSAQTWLELQVMPQPPQLVGLFSVITQAPLQSWAFRPQTGLQPLPPVPPLPPAVAPPLVAPLLAPPSLPAEDDWQQAVVKAQSRASVAAIRT